MWKFEEEHPFALAHRLVEEGKLDPWDVDISALVRAYMEEISRLELLDLRVPARAVLAASFLLKKQAEVLFPEPKQKRGSRKLTLQEIVQQFESQQEQLQEEINQRIERVRKVIRREGSGRKIERKKERRFPVHVSKFEDALEELREILKDCKSNLSFNQLIFGKSLVPYLMALMVLYQDGVVDIQQEKPYSDLKIVCLGGQHA